MQPWLTNSTGGATPESGERDFGGGLSCWKTELWISQVEGKRKAKWRPYKSAQPNGLLKKKPNYNLICTGGGGEQVNTVIQAIRAGEIGK